MAKEGAYDNLSRLEIEQRLYELEITSTRVLVAIWRQIQRGSITERGLITDAALTL